MNISDFILLGLVVGFAILFLNNMRTMLYPDKHLLILALVAVSYVGLISLEAGNINLLYSSVAGALVLSVPLYILYVATSGKYFGYGDVKLALALGLVIGFIPSLLTLFIVLFIGLLIIFVLPKVQISKRLADMRISSSYIWVVAISLSLIATKYLVS